MKETERFFDRLGLFMVGFGQNLSGDYRAIALREMISVWRFCSRKSCEFGISPILGGALPDPVILGGGERSTEL
ncbi:hypothetical protein [Tritonibacter mobilis]|uniref:Uncharacterized protein n=1 Tax=Tritonibacter mobilis F1926 TaxID=1265309 RepID=A0A1B1A2T1_9RHOB|nr:hypothetical protein [Tritonibacter mobilis]ANP40798.1 hypothetical protein K529_008485 [Tritonibacter mobilis F1926]KJZ24133.1 hypothetical protein TW79_09785 [Tritonibacter mobilis]